MNIEFKLKEEINKLQKEVDELKKETTYWKNKSYEMYSEYQLLCDKIVSKGIFSNRKKTNE